MKITDAESAPIPRSLIDYLRSFGPGIVVVLTWLGAGDIVESGIAGGNYGYSLMWILVLATLMRFLFVSLMVKYQLCNQHREGVLDGLGRLHRLYPPVLAVVAVIMGHFYCSYMTVGIGETCVNLFKHVDFFKDSKTWQWALLWNGVALAIVFRPVYRRVEWAFKILLVVLSVSFIGTALWVGPSPEGALKGMVPFVFPEQTGPFGSLLIAIGMMGTIAGSLVNLVYPYFLEAKGWRGPQYRRVQLYDFLLAIVVMIILNLAIWTLGAELLHPKGLTIQELEDLPRLLSQTLGEAGRVLFYLGVFATVFTSLIGISLGLACLGTHGYLRWKAGAGPLGGNYRDHRLYRWIVVWCVVSPLIWTHPDMPGFVTLTVVVNSLQVVLIPLLAGGLWGITASTRCIGAEYRNRWWENLFMAALFAVATWGAVGSVRTVYEAVIKMFE